MAVKNIVLPDIGEGVTEGEMVKWLVQVGDSVEVDQPVAEVMTDKATVEVPSPVAGKVKELKANEGDVIPIETTLLILDTDSPNSKGLNPKSGEASLSSPSASSPSIPSAPIPPAPSSASPEALPPHNGGIYPPVAHSKVLATPGTRRLAREMSIDINGIQGTGPVGRVTREDLLQVKGKGAVLATQASPASPRPIPSYQGPTGAVEERVPLRGIRRKIAEQMQMTKQIVPHFTLMDEANVTDLYKVRKQAKEVGKEYGVNITFLPFIMKALISALREFPESMPPSTIRLKKLSTKNITTWALQRTPPTACSYPTSKMPIEKPFLS